MAGDGWKELSTIYPRTCHECGGKVALKKGAFFSAKVDKGKIVKAESTCHTCLRIRDETPPDRCIYCGHVTRRAPTCPHHDDLVAMEDAL